MCPRTHGSRIKRHDNVVDRVAKALNEKGGHDVIKEPKIPTPEGRRKPDLVVYSSTSKTCYVVDAQVCADNADLSEIERLKVKHYDKPQVRKFIVVSTSIR